MSTLLCAVHQKQRDMRYLFELSPGVYQCAAGNECKGSGQSAVTGAGGDPDSRAPCAAHGKMRATSVMQMVQGVNGIEWRCTPTTQCKGTAPLNPQLPDLRFNPYSQALVASQLASAYPGLAGIPGMAGMAGMQGAMAGMVNPVAATTGTHAVCALHGKRRDIKHMVSCGGQYVCSVGHECKGSTAANSLIPQMNPHFVGAATPATQMPTGMCAIHQKSRAFTNLSLVNGQFVCAQGQECKVGNHSESGGAAQFALCTAHQKQRAVEFMHMGTGGYVCNPGFECKVAGDGAQQQVQTVEGTL
eukprot:NODE_2576_length_1164_cov_59.252915_g2355_i0.p1 GENE.NODE_2576_length_1164_cov_59.252915_g2355_i0~~NODE_2576_length_1164_cov_59.252915_g2355_i0.p1  ORF type:complete len:302 (-),score=29.97 NODE_2576_length_1164_cov_59.252915_g2355_i0:171-1076(-)